MEAKPLDASRRKKPYGTESGFRFSGNTYLDREFRWIVTVLVSYKQTLQQKVLVPVLCCITVQLYNMRCTSTLLL
jgi:hypothetical protein